MTNQNNAAQAVDQEFEGIMEQAQVFASAWAFFGGPFDQGDGKEQAEREEARLRDVIRDALSKLRAPVADNWQQYALPGETTAEQVCERLNAEVTRRTVAAMGASVIAHAKKHADVAASLLMEAHKQAPDTWRGWYDDALNHIDIARKDLDLASMASAPASKPKRPPVDDGMCWSSKEIQRRQKQEDDARAAYHHSRASAPVAEERAAFEAAMQMRGQDVERWPAPHGGYRSSSTEMAWYAWSDRAALASAPVAGKAQEHYDEVKATLQGAHRIMESLCAIERRVGPVGSHARGYTHKITNALRHLDALFGAPRASEAVRDALNTFGSKVFKALAAIARVDGPDTRKADDPELIYREPVMDEAVRIRQAYDELSAALSAQPGAQKHDDGGTAHG